MDREPRKKPRLEFAEFCWSVLALAIVIFCARPWYRLSINLTPSLPGTFYLIDQRIRTFQVGDLIAYRWQGGAGYPQGTVFIKQVLGVAGEEVRRVHLDFWVGERWVGLAKTHSKSGVRLLPAHPGKIAPHRYFVATPHPDSLDSRYRLSGNIRDRDVVGRAYEIF